jgi:hypothetical protein
MFVKFIILVFQGGEKMGLHQRFFYILFGEFSPLGHSMFWKILEVLGYF